MRFRWSTFGSASSPQIWSYTQAIVHHPPTKAWNVSVRNMTAVITREESTMCTPLLPRDVWTLSNSAICSLSPFLSLTHPFFKTISPWGAYATQRSNTNFTASAQYNPICSTGKKGGGVKREDTPKTNHSGNCRIEISCLLYCFDLIRPYVRIYIYPGMNTVQSYCLLRCYI